jgi:hypothetical protein
MHSDAGLKRGPVNLDPRFVVLDALVRFAFAQVSLVQLGHLIGALLYFSPKQEHRPS